MLNLAMLVLKQQSNLKTGGIPPKNQYEKQLGLPVVSAWISQDAHYAFVEFRSIEECANGFQLSQIALFGHVS